MSNPYQMSPGARPQAKRSGPIATIIIGGLMMFLAPIIGIMISAFSVMNALDIDEMGAMPLISNPGVTGVLEPGEWMVISSSEGQFSTDCTATDSAGQPANMSSAYGVFKYITVTQPDTFNVACDTGPSIMVVEKQVFDDLVGGGFTGVVLPAMIGIILGFIGFVMLIAGIIWLVAVGRRARNDAGGYGPGGYGPGGYGQPGSYGQPGGYAPPQAGGFGQQGGYNVPQSGPYNGQQGGYHSSREFGGTGQQNPYAGGPQGGPQAGPQSTPPRYGQRPEDPPQYGERL